VAARLAERLGLRLVLAAVGPDAEEALAAATEISPWEAITADGSPAEVLGGAGAIALSGVPRRRLARHGRAARGGAGFDVEPSAPIERWWSYGSPDRDLGRSGGGHGARTPWPARNPPASIVGMTALTELGRPRTTPTIPGPRRPAGGRDPAHTLYQHAAGLLAAAQSLEAATQASGAEAAMSPTLACMETSLAALASAVGRLRGLTLARLSEPVLPGEDLRPQRAEIAFELERLAGMLDQSSFACGHARAAIEPVTDELRAI
jgi:hypothetical protein